MSTFFIVIISVIWVVKYGFKYERKQIQVKWLFQLSLLQIMKSFVNISRVLQLLLKLYWNYQFIDS